MFITLSNCSREVFSIEPTSTTPALFTWKFKESYVQILTVLPFYDDNSFFKLFGVKFKVEVLLKHLYQK